MNFRLLLLFLFLSRFLSGFSQTPQRVISLASSLTRMVYLLHAENQLVGCTSYCDQAVKDHKPVVASAIDVNIEKVVSLKPTAILATTITRPATVAEFKRLGIRVIQFKTPESFGVICDQFLKIARLTGKLAYGEQIVKTQTDRLNLIKSRVPHTTRPRIFIEVGARPLFTAVSKSFMGEYISDIGGENIAYGLKIGAISRETVLLRNPDVIIIVTMGMVGKQEIENWKKFKQLSACQTGRIFTIDAAKACAPTPVDFVDVTGQFFRMAYGKP